MSFSIFADDKLAMCYEKYYIMFFFTIVVGLGMQKNCA
jgi:hypothetical protein